jgi:hypothetical protein
MATIIAYFDESYSHPPAPVVYTIAGYLSTVERWQQFQKRWKAILDIENLPPFSMKEFDNQHSKIYGNWGKERKISFLQNLHEVIKDTYIKSFSTSILKEDYDALSIEEQYAFGKPHSMAATNCLKLIAEWSSKVNLQESILYVFEKGSLDDKHLNFLFNKSLVDEMQNFYRIENLTFETKNSSPLQAADILAYETRKEVSRRYFVPHRQIRGSIRNLHDSDRDEWVIMDIIQMEKVVNHPDFKDAVGNKEFKSAAAFAKKKGVI